MVGKQIKCILVVDDESNIINAIQRELNSPPFVAYRYEVEGFTDPQCALERAREQAFDAVISDYRMPDMDGLEFLTALAIIQPDCARIVLSGQTDMDGLIRMINESRIYRFIPKPWHAYWLKTSLCQALDHSAALLEHQRLAALVLPANIIAAIRHHHAPDTALREPLVPLVHVAEVLSNALDLTGREENRVTSISSAACKALGLTWDESVRTLFGRMEARSRHANSMFQQT